MAYVYLVHYILKKLGLVRLKNIYKVNYHEGFSIYTVYDLILAGTINDIDPSIFRNLLQKNIN